jgi:hypothetical protein
VYPLCTTSKPVFGPPECSLQWYLLAIKKAHGWIGASGLELGKLLFLLHEQARGNVTGNDRFPRNCQRDQDKLWILLD